MPQTVLDHVTERKTSSPARSTNIKDRQDGLPPDCRSFCFGLDQIEHLFGLNRLGFSTLSLCNRGP